MNAPGRDTEQRNPRTLEIDTWPSADVIRAMLHEDSLAIAAAAHCSDSLALLVDAAVDRVRRGGKVHYFGAGASGRLALLDATEATPTFGTATGFFTAHFPGGTDAFMDSQLDYEDSEDLGAQDATGLTKNDIVIGISASGRTAYVQGALDAAHTAGALVALITSNPDGPLGDMADIVIAPDTGAEAITGSTRLKAGTATKILINAFSTTLMIRLGRTYSNLMVDLTVTNSKLQQRAVQILQMATGADQERAERVLDETGGRVPPALVSLLTGLSVARSVETLAGTGSVRAAVDGTRS